MKAIMISDKPKWCALMMNGIKIIEVRKNKALATAIQKLIDEYGYADIYVYCTFPKKHHELLDKDLVSGQWKLWYGTYTPKNGKVPFKFRCYKVEEILPFEEYESPFGMAYKLTKDKIVCCQKAQLTYDEYNHYLKGKKGCSIHISDLEIFDKPKELSEFSVRYPKADIKFESVKGKMLAMGPLTKAPKNFCYIEVEQLSKELERLNNKNLPCSNCKELKALEIIKNKRVNVEALFYSASCEDYNKHYTHYEDLIKEEYDLLKGELE